ncbi:hypothetical protein [Clostridium haemolyticum]|uniref:Uncharacterized protein n=1 Tax=Clostridium haemolyticum NCTC 9693 TaxID=1443114 RepID=A0ABR4TAU1_CLOHA|nr:hypothetical protein [Clostridium haemolyticum]KEI14066.1 hypothetical protein Z960_p0067 [Clostridium haemolyticum NCTC 9693]
MRYWNVVKREVKTNEYVKIVKSYPCFGRTDIDIKYKAESKTRLLNLLRYINNKYYYVVEFDFE